MMNKERVSIIKGKRPIIFISPHSLDDINTDIIAETMAKSLKGYAVINNGWGRSLKYDYSLEKADCNKISHVENYVIKQEFLHPILKFKNQILKKHKKCYIFIIHGVGSHIKKTHKDLDLILGIGEDTGPRNTFIKWKEELLMFLIQENTDMCPYKGITQYGGKWKDNLNQLFRNYNYIDNRVESMQVEICYNWRENRGKSLIFADNFGFCTELLISNLEAGAKGFTNKEKFKCI